MSASPYTPRRQSASQFVRVRGFEHHVNTWGNAALASPERPPLLLLHGWMDVGASFQFVVDALQHDRFVLAPDWRGFGLTEAPSVDTYWFPDYLGDLDGLLDALLPGQAVDLAGHSMGGNVAMSYAGVRPARIRRLVNLEGFGLPATKPHHAPKRLVQWLDELKAPQSLRSYASLDEVAERLQKNNPRLTADKAAWLAPHWSERKGDGRWHILGDPAHKLANPVLYHRDETLEAWKLIEAPTLWVEGAQTDISKWWGDRYPRADFEERLACVRQVQRVRLEDCGHMLHHDQPLAVAQALEAFLDAA